MNMRPFRGFQGFVFNKLGFTGPTPRVSLPSRLILIKDKPGLKTLLQQLAAVDGLKRVIFSHGDTLESGAAEGLRQALATF